MNLTVFQNTHLKNYIASTDGHWPGEDSMLGETLYASCLQQMDPTESGKCDERGGFSRNKVPSGELPRFLDLLLPTSFALLFWLFFSSTCEISSVLRHGECCHTGKHRVPRLRSFKSVLFLASNMVVP